SIAGTVTYDMPINRSGTKVSLSQTLSAIKVIHGPTEPLNITGASKATTLTLSQPFFIESEWTVLGLMSGSHGDSQSWSSEVPLVDTVTSKAALGFALSYAGDGASFSVQPQLVYVHAKDRLFDDGRDLLI